MTQTAKAAATLLRPGLHHQTEGEEDRLGGVAMKFLIHMKQSGQHTLPEYEHDELIIYIKKDWAPELLCTW